MIVLFRKPIGTAAESWGFFLNSGSTVVGTWTSGTDPISLQILVDGTYQNVLDTGGLAVTLTPTAPNYTVNGAATYRVTAGTGSAITATATQAI